MIVEMSGDFGAFVDDSMPSKPRSATTCSMKSHFLRLASRQCDIGFGQYQLKRQARYARTGTDVDDATSVEPACCCHTPAGLNGDPEGTDEELLEDGFRVLMAVRLVRLLHSISNSR